MSKPFSAESRENQSAAHLAEVVTNGRVLPEFHEVVSCAPERCEGLNTIFTGLDNFDTQVVPLHLNVAIDGANKSVIEITVGVGTLPLRNVGEEM